MMVAMVPVTRLYADRDGNARFEDTEGFGHSSRSAEGFLAAFVVLEG